MKYDEEEEAEGERMMMTTVAAVAASLSRVFPLFVFRAKYEAMLYVTCLFEPSAKLVSIWDELVAETHTRLRMTIEHAMDDEKWIDDQSSRWIFDLGKTILFFAAFCRLKTEGHRTSDEEKRERASERASERLSEWSNREEKRNSIC